MPNFSRQVLTIDLSQRRSSYGSFADLGHLLGGLGIGLDLVRQYQQDSPTVFSIGPLNGFFPFASKVSCLSLLLPGKVAESYLSGCSSLMMRFAGIDAIVIKGTSTTPLYVSVYPGGVVDFLDHENAREAFLKSGVTGRRSFMTFSGNESLADDYFIIDQETGRKLFLSNLLGLSVSGDTSLPILKEREYKELYLEILGRGGELDVPYDGRLSCGGCPAGCEFSNLPEQKYDLTLSHCLVTCGFSGRIYESVPFVFSCLNALGLPYKHEDLEALSDRIKYIRQHI